MVMKKRKQRGEKEIETIKKKPNNKSIINMY